MKKKKFSKLVRLLMSILLLFCTSSEGISYLAGAVTEDDELSSYEEYGIDDYEPMDEEQVETFGTIWNEPIKNPQLKPRKNKINSRNIADTTTRDNDLKVTLPSLTTTECASQGNGTRLKNIINTASGVNRNALLTELSKYFIPSANTKLCASLQGSCSAGEYIFFSFVVYERTAGGSPTRLGSCIASCKFNNDILETVKLVNSK